MKSRVRFSLWKNKCNSLLQSRFVLERGFPLDRFASRNAPLESRFIPNLMKTRYRVFSVLLFLGLAAVAWRFTKNVTSSSLSSNEEEVPSYQSAPTKTASQHLPREQSVTNKGQAKDAVPMASEVSDESVEMRNLAAVPVSVGKKGLWAGAAPSDAAIPGKTAYVLARLGDSKADLRPDQNGMFQRLHAPVDSSIEFQIRYADLKKDDLVHVGLLDGGKLEDEGPLKPDAMGRIAFKFQTGPSDGSYRISLTTSDHDAKMIDVWAGRPEWEQPVTSN